MPRSLAVLRTSALAIILVFSCGIPAVAVCPAPHSPRVCTEFFISDATFVGTVTSSHYLTRGLAGHDPGWSYELKVTKVYRGLAAPIIRVFTENNSGRFPLELGHEYLLFADKDAAQWNIDGCGNSAELSQADTVVHQIKQVLQNMNSASGGDIAGQIAKEYVGAEGVSGISVAARTTRKSYTGVTGIDGQFHIHVPAGEYSVIPESSNWIVSIYDLSYQQPDKVLIVNGGCADLQFVASHG